jgi:hypothetical protein
MVNVLAVIDGVPVILIVVVGIAAWVLSGLRPGDVP